MYRVHCPICQRLLIAQRPRQWPQYPFCSPKCKLVDLGRWLGESYRINEEYTEEVLHRNDTLSESP